MKNLLTFIYIASWVLHIYCSEIPTSGDTCTYEGDGADKCLPDVKGYGSWRCTGIRINFKYVKSVWVKRERETNCTDPLKPTCSCFVNDWLEQECKCINTRIPPSFPPTGVIRWNGTSYYDDDNYVGYGNSRSVYIPGEVHKDKNGRYLRKWTEKGYWKYQSKEIPDTWVAFEIIIPKGKYFIKYTGNEHSGECSKENVSTSGQLDSIWPKHKDRQVYRIVGETPKEANMYTQHWEIFIDVEDGYDGWKWTVEYDSKRKYAIPTRYFHKSVDGSDGRLWQRKLLYTYEPIEEGDESFKVEDYCSNV